MSCITDIITVLAWPKRIPATKMSPVFSFTPKYLDSPTEYLVYFEVFSSYEINKNPLSYQTLWQNKHYYNTEINIMQKERSNILIHWKILLDVTRVIRLRMFVCSIHTYNYNFSYVRNVHFILSPHIFPSILATYNFEVLWGFFLPSLSKALIVPTCW